MMFFSAKVSKIKEYTIDTKALTIDSSQLFQRIITQITHSTFKIDDSSSVSDSLKTRKPRLTIRRSSLFYLQLTLNLLNITVICCVIIIRLKSCLKEDSVTLTALSLIVVYNQDFQRRIKSKDHLDDKSYEKMLEDLKVRFNVDENLTSLIKTRNSIVSVITYFAEIIRASLSFK